MWWQEGQAPSEAGKNRWSLLVTVLHRALRSDHDGWNHHRREYRPETAALRAGAWTIEGARSRWRAPWIALLTPASTSPEQIAAAWGEIDAVILDYDDTFAATPRNLEHARATLRTLREHPLPVPVGLRPRPVWLREPTITVDGEPAIAAAVDVATFLDMLAERCSCFVCLPKIATQEEAERWARALAAAERVVGLPEDSLVVILQVELLAAVFEIDELLWTLRNRAVGLAAGRWDYFASVVRTLGTEVVFPPAEILGNEMPFLWASFHAIAQAAHRRGVLAAGSVVMGTPAAGSTVTLEGKQWEAQLGFGATWVTDPSWAPLLRKVLAGAHEPTRRSERQLAEALLTVPSVQAISVRALERTLRQLAGFVDAWRRGRAVLVHGRQVEDLSTAEARRALLWNWTLHEVPLLEGDRLTAEQYRWWCKRVAGTDGVEILEELVLGKQLNAPLPRVLPPRDEED